MTFRKLEILYCVAEKLNMIEVSKDKYISQPVISKIIKALEEALGVKLFSRLGKKVFLTDEGEMFKNYARRIINLYTEFGNILEDMKDFRKGKLRVGASSEYISCRV